ncbi:hypothetical protein [Natronomonas amylolytica]|uniref:hypothetical protein n=1 Tax=Natronomonas amylolytica TaxID=3108498 RepID=UPI003008BC4F
MDWTKPLSFVLALFIVSLVIRSVFQLLQTTLTGEYVTASVATLVLVGIIVLAAIGLGVKNRQWLANPESYF